MLVATLATGLLLWLLLPIGFARDMAGSAAALFSFLLLYPLVEELLFRGLVQGELLRHPFWRHRRVGLSHANLATSLVFVLVHVIHQPPIWTSTVLIPSLVLGHFRERYNSLVPPMALHMMFNLTYLCAGLPTP